MISLHYCKLTVFCYSLLVVRARKISWHTASSVSQVAWSPWHRNQWCWMCWSTLNLCPLSDSFSNQKRWMSLALSLDCIEKVTAVCNHLSNFLYGLMTLMWRSIVVCSCPDPSSRHFRIAVHRTSNQAQFCCCFTKSYTSVSQNTVFKFFDAVTIADWLLSAVKTFWPHKQSWMW